MRRAMSYGIRLLTCKRGSTLVGYSSLALLVAIAAIALLGQTDAAGNKAPGAAGTTTPN